MTALQILGAVLLTFAALLVLGCLAGGYMRYGRSYLYRLTRRRTLWPDGRPERRPPSAPGLRSVRRRLSRRQLQCLVIPFSSRRVL